MTLSKKMLSLLFLMILIRQLFSAFATHHTTSNKKIDAKICTLISVFFKPIIPQFQHSIIPTMSEATNLKGG
jgi:hypothetical protein